MIFGSRRGMRESCFDYFDGVGFSGAKDLGRVEFWGMDVGKVEVVHLMMGGGYREGV